MTNHIEISPVVVVVDIETLGRGERAVIGTIGATCINLLTGEHYGDFYTRIDLQLPQPNREINEDTVLWWQQLARYNPAAWLEMYDVELPRGTLQRALESLGEWLGHMKLRCPDDSYLQVLGNGPEFDNAALAHAFESHGMAIPWQFRANQSLRTPVWLARLLLGTDPKYTIPFTGTQHHALDDAKHEAAVLLDIFNQFRQRLS